MIPPIQVIKAVGYYVTGLPSPAIFRYIFRHDTGNNDEAHVGDCFFWGPSDFITVCKRAMSDLRGLDEDLFHHLTTSGRRTFWLEPEKLGPVCEHAAKRFYFVSPAFYAWAEQGVIAILVSTCFRERSAYHLFGVSTAIPKAGTSSRQSTAMWLREKQFPTELIDCFEPSSAPSA